MEFHNTLILQEPQIRVIMSAQTVQLSIVQFVVY